ncbi:transposase domain-containing protein [Paracoccus alkanivorans]|nr:transposase domain-containing protein [Paracoccus alkanivorans]
MPKDITLDSQDESRQPFAQQSLCSLIGTCKLNGIEPHAYFKWIFEQVANKLPRSQYDKLLPWHCPKGRHGIE